MYRITTLCSLVCLSLTACTVSLAGREMLTSSSGVSPTPGPTLSAPSLGDGPVLSPVPPTSTPAPTATSSPQPPATPTTFAMSSPTVPSETPPATATLSPVVLPDHALSKPVTLFKAEGPEVYLVEETTWTHRHIVDWETFLHLGFEQSDIVTSTRFAGYPEGPPITRLLKGAGERVYWMENGQRRHIPDVETFLHLGHRQEDISEIPDELLVSWPLGEPLPSVLGTPAEPVPPLSQEMVVLTYSPRDRWGGGNHIWEIYTVFTDGTRPRRLSHTTSYMVYSGPVWSPDGRYIAFSSRPYANGGPMVVTVTSFDSWEPTRLREYQGYYPVWSPDGTRIAFWSPDDTFGGVYVMDADGGNTHWLASGSVPGWTPDGRIAFCAGNMEGPESILTLTVMDADGQNQQPVGHSITVLDQHYYPWRQEVWIAGADPCGPTEP